MKQHSEESILKSMLLTFSCDSTPFFLTLSTLSSCSKLYPADILRKLNTTFIIILFLELSLCHCLFVYRSACMSSGSSVTTATNVLIPRNMTLWTLCNVLCQSACATTDISTHGAWLAVTQAPDTLWGRETVKTSQIEEPVPFIGQMNPNLIWARTRWWKKRDILPSVDLQMEKC